MKDATQAGSLVGQLLIAMPSITQGQLSHSVVFMCAHSAEGAMGIQINRPLHTPSFDDLLQQLKIEPAPPSRRIELMSGGPVDHSRGFVLHTSDWTMESSLIVDGQHALTASLDVLKAIADGGGPALGLLALGYVGWAAGQLDDELRAGAWLEAPADSGLLFDAEYASKWRRALAKLQIDPVGLSGEIGHA